MTDPSAGTSQRPYLIRAMHEWMTDNGFTPHIVVDDERAGGGLPPEHVRDGKIVLNVGYAATRNLELGHDRVALEARFGGVPRRLDIPVDAVLCIYARETGQGMIFGGDAPPDPNAPPPDPGAPPPGDRPKLTVVK